MFSFLHNTIPSAIAFHLGPVPIRWYGIMLTIGVVVAYFLARQCFYKSGRNPIEFDRLLLPLVIIGLLGARLFNVFIFEWDYFKNHLNEMWYVWQGGLAFQGGLFFAGMYAWWWSMKQKIHFLVLADIVAPALAIGQAIGRVGNYFNQEIFGLPTNLPWGIKITPEFRPAEFSSSNYFHPVFLYELIGLVILGVALLMFSRKPKPAGFIFGWYLIGSGILRLLLEFIRIDEQMIFGGVRVGMILSFFVIIVGFIMLVRYLSNPSYNKNKREL